MPNPICPVCGEEMEFVSITEFWRCPRKEGSHIFCGPSFDQTGEKTRSMIAKIRQEALVETLEKENHDLKNRILELEHALYCKDVTPRNPAECH